MIHTGTVQGLLLVPSRTRRGRSRRGGFWTLKPCRICGAPFEIRQHPDKAPNPRCTCGPACSDENSRRLKRKWDRENPKRKRDHKAAYAKRRARMAEDPEYAADCKAKARVSTEKYNKKHPEKRAAANRAWAENNKEARKLYAQEYYRKNKDKITKQHKEWKAENPEVVKRIQDDFLARHPGYNAEYAKRRRQAQKVPAP